MDLLKRLFYSVVSAATVCYFLVRYARGYWERRGILCEKPHLLWGNLKDVGRKRHVMEALQRLYTTFKGKAPFMGFYVWLKPVILMLDLDAVHLILSNEGNKYFIDGGLYHYLHDGSLSANAMQLDGAERRLLSRKMRLAFTSEYIKHTMPALLKAANNCRHSLQTELKTECVCDINELVQGYSIDVLSLIFGLEGDSVWCGRTEFRSMRKCYKNNLSYLKASLAFSFPILARLLQYRSYDQTPSHYLLDLINDRLEECERRRGGQNGINFLKILTETHRKHSESGPTSSDNQQAAAQAFSFILSSLEACNTTLIYCLYELSLQPGIQEKARKEIGRVLSKQREPLNQENLKEFVYLKQILNETLRKHPPYPFLLRLTVQDYEIPNSVFMLQRGNHLIIPVAAIHQDSQFFEQPHKFDPDHFDGIAVEKRPSTAFLPFGLGPQSCVAQSFAQNQMLVFLITLLREYSFTPCRDTCIPLDYDISKLMAVPKSHLKLLVKRI